MKKLFILLSLVLPIGTASSQEKTMDEFIDELMSKMTFEEKVGQLNLISADDVNTGPVKGSPVVPLIEKGMVGGVFNVRGLQKIKGLQELAVKKTRLGIPLLVGLDIVHGYETVFPVPLAQACSWDLQSVTRCAQIASDEAASQGVNWLFSPMVDVSHEPRWGRVVEGYGEDPYLSGSMGAATIQGYKSSGKVLSCLKHFALYGGVESGKDYTTVDMSRGRMFNLYLPSYKACVEAGVETVMSSYNIVDGIPATGNKWLLTGVLRDMWGFRGMVVSDFNSIGEMNTLGFGDCKVSAIQAINADTDMDMVTGAYVRYLKEAVNENKVPISRIDEAVRRVLETKYRAGLFDDPYRCYASKKSNGMYTPESRKAARDFAAETFVLLKNEGHLLPLKKQGTIALIGPLADSRNNIAGTWAQLSVPEKYSAIRESMQRYLGTSAKVVYAQGCNIYGDSVRQRAVEFGRPIAIGDNDRLLSDAVDVAKKSDVIVACLGETAEMTGEGSTRVHLTLPDVQMRLLKALVATGKPVVLLNFAGRPTVLTWENEYVQAVMNVWFPGSEAGDAICDVLFGDKSPSGKLVNTFPRSVGQLPLYYNHIRSSRPKDENSQIYQKYISNYVDEINGPLYHFGYGLSYTTYSYSDVTLSASSMTKGGKVKASVTVTNTGDRDGDEVVQMYVHDICSSIVRPVEELKGFKRVHIASGESVTVSFDIDATTLQYLDANGNPMLETGDFEILIGPNCKDVKRAKLMLR